ncbi:MAG: phosphate signaling complex protein PhoU [Synergistaceae bacterium]|jgi:phosphate transport system protein|nr:phosphate signaling complex protein PhoU [Synergistaceae bacterium]
MAFNIRKQQDSDLVEIKRMLFHLGKISENAVIRAVWALENGDSVMARAVIDGDDALDELTGHIDANCMSFGARYQPLGRDLRTITSIMHMAVDLERVGDYGVNIARAALEMEGRVLIKPLIDIPRMAAILSEMLDKALDAFDAGNAEMAQAVFAMDELVDELEKQVVRELFTMIMERVDRLEQAFLLMNVARTLERAGDHATNIAERVIYMCAGKTVKASEFKRPREVPAADGPEKARP